MRCTMNRLLVFGPLLVVLLLLGSQTALTQQPKAAATKAGTAADEEQIRKAVVDFVDLYNAHKAAEVAALFAADARVVYRDGTEENGREEIKKSFEEAFSAHPKASMSVVVEEIRFLTPDVAVEEGFTTMFPDGETLT